MPYTNTYDNLGRTSTRVRRDASDVITESTTLVYDSDGALRSFTRTGADAVSVTYDQDAVGRRIARRVGGSVTARWLYRGIHPVAEYDGVWVLRRVFVYGTRGHVPDYVLANEGGTWVPYRVVTDHLGSVRRVLRVSDGAVVQRMSYDAYGRVLDDVVVSGWTALPFGYAGGIYDRDTGLVRFGARDYDAEIGRWTAKDPIGFNGGDSNIYVYVGNSPHERFDPSGLFGVNELASYLPGINLFAAGVRERANGIFEMGSEATVERGACRAQHGAAMIGLGAGAAGMFAMLAVGVVSMAAPAAGRLGLGLGSGEGRIGYQAWSKRNGFLTYDQLSSGGSPRPNIEEAMSRASEIHFNMEGFVPAESWNPEAGFGHLYTDFEYQEVLTTYWHKVTFHIGDDLWYGPHFLHPPE